jgi:hypothetical protein
MATRIITLKDGIRVEAEVTESRVASTDGKVEQTIDSVKPTLVNVARAVASAWNELGYVEQAEIELGFGFEASGHLFVASTKGNVNLSVKLVLKHAPAPKQEPPSGGSKPG